MLILLPRFLHCLTSVKWSVCVARYNNHISSSCRHCFHSDRSRNLLGEGRDFYRTRKFIIRSNTRNFQVSPSLPLILFFLAGKDLVRLASFPCFFHYFFIARSDGLQDTLIRHCGNLHLY